MNIFLIRESKSSLVTDFDTAALRLLGPPSKSEQGRQATKTGQQEEQAYSIAYKKLVQEGLVMKLKKKYSR